MKTILSLLTLVTIMVTQMYGSNFPGPNDLPGNTSHDNYDLKPSFKEDRHRCEDSNIKTITKGYVLGGWDKEYTLMYNPKTLVAKGNYVHVKGILLTTLINHVTAGEGEGYIVVDMVFNTHIKKYAIEAATERTCAKEVVSRYTGLTLWEDIPLKSIDQFYLNTVIKTK